MNFSSEVPSIHTRARRSSIAEVLGIVPCQAKIEIKIPHIPIILHIGYVR